MGSGVGSISLHDKAGREGGWGYIQRGDSVVVRREGGKEGRREGGKEGRREGGKGETGSFEWPEKTGGVCNICIGRF